jgi:hypothetical protein
VALHQVRLKTSHGSHLLMSNAIADAELLMEKPSNIRNITVVARSERSHECPLFSATDILQVDYGTSSIVDCLVSQAEIRPAEDLEGGTDAPPSLSKAITHPLCFRFDGEDLSSLQQKSDGKARI